MKKSRYFLLLFIPSLLAWILSTFFASLIENPILNLISLIGSICFFSAWAYVFWTLGIFYQTLVGSTETEFPGLKIENIKVYIEELGFNIYGKILTSCVSNEKTPLVIVLTGGGGHHMKLIGMGSLLVNFGLKVILFDHPGIIGESHGTTPESKIRSVTRSILTLRKIIDYIISRKDIKTEKIGLIGKSLGAFTVVYGGFSDHRISVIIGQSVGLIENKEDLEKIKKIMPWWFKKYCQFIKLDINDMLNLDYKQFKNPKFEALRNRVYLLQTKDDKMVTYESFFKLKEILQLADENCLVFEKGGHGFMQHQSSLIGWILGKLRKHFFTS